METEILFLAGMLAFMLVTIIGMALIDSRGIGYHKECQVINMLKLYLDCITKDKVTLQVSRATARRTGRDNYFVDMDLTVYGMSLTGECINVKAMVFDNGAVKLNKEIDERYLKILV